MSRPDRRVLRTQEALTRAMLELILEKGFEATNVSEIADRANVGRSTFYAHFADKDDLLQGSVAQLRGFLEGEIATRAAAGAARGHPALAFCEPMLEHANEMRELFAATVGRRGGYLMQELLHDMWTSLVRASWPEADELAVRALVGAFASTLLWWLTSAPELAPAAVARRFRAFAEPALAG